MPRTPARTRTPRNGARPSRTLALLAALVLGIPGLGMSAGAARPALALEAARERLAQLGPKPKDTQESADVAEQRVEREAAVTRIDETQRLARSLVVQGDQIVDRVSNRRRESFTRDLFQRSQPLAGPGLWAKVMGDVPRDTRALQSAVSDIGLLFSRNGSIGNLLILGLAFGISIALYFGRRNIAPRG